MPWCDVCVDGEGRKTVYTHNEKEAWLHEAEFHPDRCKTCKKIFSTKDVAEQHLYSGKHKGLRRCSYLGCMFLGKPEEILNHQVLIHADARLKCRINDCKVTLETPEERDIHENADHFNSGNIFLHYTELKTKEVKCPVCSETRSRAENVAHHILRDHHFSHIKCYGNNCLAVFTEEEELKKHMDLCKSAKYICEICKQGFRLKPRYDEHMNRYHKEDEVAAGVKYSCDIMNCNYEATSLKDMTEHKKESHKDIYECELCKEKFTTGPELCSHMKREHPKYSHDYKQYGDCFDWTTYSVRMNISTNILSQNEYMADKHKIKKVVNNTSLPYKLTNINIPNKRVRRERRHGQELSELESESNDDDDDDDKEEENSYLKRKINKSYALLYVMKNTRRDDHSKFFYKITRTFKPLLKIEECQMSHQEYTRVKGELLTRHNKGWEKNDTNYMPTIYVDRMIRVNGIFQNDTMNDLKSVYSIVQELLCFLLCGASNEDRFSDTQERTRISIKRKNVAIWRKALKANKLLVKFETIEEWNLRKMDLSDDISVDKNETDKSIVVLEKEFKKGLKEVYGHTYIMWTIENGCILFYVGKCLSIQLTSAAYHWSVKDTSAFGQYMYKNKESTFNQKRLFYVVKTRDDRLDEWNLSQAEAVAMMTVAMMEFCKVEMKIGNDMYKVKLMNIEMIRSSLTEADIEIMRVVSAKLGFNLFFNIDGVIQDIEAAVKFDPLLTQVNNITVNEMTMYSPYADENGDKLQ